MLSISVETRSLEYDGRKLRVSPQFFQLYCLLAYERARGRDHFLTAREIHRLFRWKRASVESIGKSINRHITVMGRPGNCLIETPPRASTKLFRLREVGGRINFDRPLSDVGTFLALDLAVPPDPNELDKALRFSWASIRAKLQIAQGGFQEARSALEEADQVPDRPPHDQMERLQLWSRLLEYEGRFQEALDRAIEALDVGHRFRVDYLTQARARIRAGFLCTMLRKPELYPQAKTHYLEGHRLLECSRHFNELFEIATGLGHLARREGDLDSALSHFLSALEYARLEGSAFGIQAALFNLGLVQAERGDFLKSPGARAAAYQEAKRWLLRAYEFVQKVEIRYTSEGQAVLAHVCLRLKQASEALTWANRALESARSVGNRKSEAVALAALGEALIAIGMSDQAASMLLSAQEIYRELGFAPDVERMANMLAQTRHRN